MVGDLLGTKRPVYLEIREFIFFQKLAFQSLLLGHIFLFTSDFGTQAGKKPSYIISIIFAPKPFNISKCYQMLSNYLVWVLLEWTSILLEPINLWVQYQTQLYQKDNANVDI